VALSDLALDHRVLESLRGGERSQHVGYGGTGLSESFGELLLGEVVRFHHEYVGARGLDRIQVGALQILDERELETVPHLLADDRRNGRLPGEARGKDSPMSGDELVPVSIGRYHNRLQNAVAGD